MNQAPPLELNEVTPESTPFDASLVCGFLGRPGRERRGGGVTARYVRVTKYCSTGKLCMLAITVYCSYDPPMEGRGCPGTTGLSSRRPRLRALRSAGDGWPPRR